MSSQKQFEYTLYTQIISFPSIVFLLLFTLLNAILFTEVILYLFFSLSKSYVIYTEFGSLLIILGYIEVLYHRIGLRSRIQFIYQFFIGSIRHMWLQKIQKSILVVGFSYLSIGIVSSIAGFEIPYIFIISLFVVQSQFWVVIYYFLFKYTSTDTLELSELQDKLESDDIDADIYDN